jgi:hypothetical protein
MGVSNIRCGDDRFYNNIFIAMDTKQLDRESVVSGYGLEAYNRLDNIHPVFAQHNVYYNGAKPFSDEADFILHDAHNPGVKVTAEGNTIYLEITLKQSDALTSAALITTDLLGKTVVAGQCFENPDGSALSVDRDYFGKKRNQNSPSAGPFENRGSGTLQIKVW